MELVILNRKFCDLKDTKTPGKNSNLRNLVKNHVTLIDCSRRLEEVFSPTFLFNFVQSSLVISFLAFSSSTSYDASKLLFNVSYCAAMLNQIWLLCYFGQKVINSSESIAVGVYESGWENDADSKMRKSLGKIMMRSQRPIKFTAMKFREISLESFAKVWALHFLLENLLVF